MYHIFLIHSSADGHLGCFHVLAMINSAAMNTGVHMSLSDLVSLVCMPRSGNSLLFLNSVHSKQLEIPFVKIFTFIRGESRNLCSNMVLT